MIWLFLGIVLCVWFYELGFRNYGGVFCEYGWFWVVGFDGVGVVIVLGSRVWLVKVGDDFELDWLVGGVRGCEVCERIMCVGYE